MARKENCWFMPSRFDLVLLGIAATQAAAGALLLWLSPTGWSWYRFALDIRFWPPWKTVALAILVVESLVVIRFWPSNRRRTKPMQNCGSTEGN